MTEKKNQIKDFFHKLAQWVKKLFLVKKTAAQELYYNNSPSAIKDGGSYIYGTYAEALHEKIKAPKSAYNIGIIASYGAGKSSLIATYKEKYKLKDNESIIVSLANFNEESKKKNEALERICKTGENKSGLNPCMDLEGEIEKSILQQILYREDAKNLPNSRVARIDTNHTVRAFIISLFVFFIAAAVVVLSLMSSGVIDFCKEIYKNTTIYLAWGAIVLFSAGILFMLLQSRLLQKVKLRDIEVELGTTKDGIFSPLNRFIEEIIYFFQKTKCRIVFVEDLDRFEETPIFSKLRELNTMINNAVVIKHKVVFVYAIKEAQFKDETERAKFFDYILSLSPALTHANACDEIIKRQKKLRELGIDFEDNNFFIKSISSFVPDMRVLNNIFNDYILMHQILDFAKTNDDTSKAERERITERNIKLFAMMVYKNLYPQDYSSLQIRGGDIGGALANKHKFLSSRLESIRIKYNEAQQKYKELTNQLVADFDLLRVVVYGAIIACGTSGIQGTQLSEIVPTNGFASTQYYITAKSNNAYFYASKTDIDAQIKPYTMIGLEKQIIDKSSASLSVKRAEIETLAKTIEEISRLSFKDAANRFATDEKIVELYGRNHGTLTGFLLSYGYIAEDYMEFITKEQTAFLSKADRETKTAILARQHKGFEHKIEVAENLISEIPLEFFSSENVLYFDIAKVLVSSTVTLKDFISKKSDFFAYLSSNNPKTNEFIIKFFTADSANVLETEKREFLNKLTESYIGFADEIIVTANSELKQTLTNMLCETCTINTLKTQNAQGILTQYINGKKRFLDNAPICDYEKFSSILTSLNIKLIDCSCHDGNYGLLQLVLLFESFAINKDNIKFLLVDYLKVNEMTAETATYTSIISSGNAEIINYARKGIGSILAIILNNKIILEEQAAINEFILSSEITVDLKKKLIEKQDSNKPFDVDANFANDFLVLALDKQKVVPNWSNLLICYDKLKGNPAKIHNSLLQFIKDKATELSRDTLDANCEFARQIINNKSMSDDNTFTQLVKSYKESITYHDQITVDENYAILIKNGNISFTAQTLSCAVTKNFYKGIDAFATLDFKVFTIEIAQCANKAGAIIQNSEISQLKQLLFTNYYTNTTYIPRPYSKEFLDTILTEVKNGYTLTFPMLQIIIPSPNCDATIKQEFFIRGLAQESDTNIKNLLPHLSEYQEILTIAKPFTKSKAEYNIDILELLKEKKIISYNIKKDDIEFI